MKGILFTFLFCQASLSAQNLVISEFMAANTNGLKDEDGDRSDWLEILNVSSAGVNLAGWSLTDDPAQPTQWTFPPLTLGANQRVLIFASDKDRSDAAGELHANFKLKASGDYLALVQPNGTTVEHGYIPTYPDQFDDISYGLGELGGLGGLGGLSGLGGLGGGSPWLLLCFRPQLPWCPSERGRRIEVNSDTTGVVGLNRHSLARNCFNRNHYWLLMAPLGS